MSTFTIPTSSPVYVGGSRHATAASAVCSAISHFAVKLEEQKKRVHVGCQFGVDKLMLESLTPNMGHQVFSVFGLYHYEYTHHIPTAYRLGHNLTENAGGTTPPIKARFLLRSLAALQGVGVAVFFSPGAGSLSVARHALKQEIPVLIWAQKPLKFTVSLNNIHPTRVSFMELPFLIFEPKQKPLF